MIYKSNESIPSITDIYNIYLFYSDTCQLIFLYISSDLFELLWYLLQYVNRC